MISVRSSFHGQLLSDSRGGSLVRESSAALVISMPTGTGDAPAAPDAAECAELLTQLESCGSSTGVSCPRGHPDISAGILVKSR